MSCWIGGEPVYRRMRCSQCVFILTHMEESGKLYDFYAHPTGFRKCEILVKHRDDGSQMVAYAHPEFEWDKPPYNVPYKIEYVARNVYKLWLKSRGET